MIDPNAPIASPPLPTLPDGYDFTGWQPMSWQGHIIKRNAQPPFNAHIVSVGHNPSDETVQAATDKAIRNLETVVQNDRMRG